jgi:oxygen-independent coproporphyrinogen-3 oxidase
LCEDAVACYVHVPFCLRKCPYCDFYSRPNRTELMEAYVVRCEEILSGALFHFSTVYVGGGTPSALPPALLRRLLQAVNAHRADAVCEFTVECNPSSCTAQIAETLAQCGVNRVSLGVQSAVDAERRTLGRAGSAENAATAVGILRGVGITNLNLDRMLGIPGQSAETLEKSIAFCAALSAQHISAYILKVEANTPFAARDPGAFPGEDDVAALYTHACRALAVRGYAQYEISNFSHTGFESQHNLVYWNAAPYFALGPGAHGFTHGKRWHYSPNLDLFLRGAVPISDGHGGDLSEYVMLRLRLTQGVRYAAAYMRYPNCAAALRKADLCAAQFAAQGLAQRDAEGFCLTEAGFLLSNHIIGEILARMEAYSDT